MSIATEISRLQTAKADIKTAIEAKGVTVPSNATLDTYDTYVSQIQTGGGTNYLEQYANRSIPNIITSTQLGTNIGSNMASHLFYDQENITAINLTGTGVTKISNYFCAECANLVNVTIPNTVTEIGNNFCQNTKVASFTIPSSVTKFGTHFLGGSRVTSLTIPSTVTSVGNDCLYNNAHIEVVHYNANIAALPQSFCFNTNSLALVDLNSSVTSIGKFCLSRSSASTNLLEVVLRNTSGVVTLPNAIGATGSNSAFRYRRNIKIYVPSALIASYQADAN